MWFTILSTVVGAAFNAIKSIWSNAKQDQLNEQQLSLAQQSLDQNKEIANKNFDLSKEQFEYQKQLNELTMQREDTAFQRQVADLKAAGLSPLMVAGNGAAATPLNSANAPQYDMSGINQAMTNFMGAYNDAFNRNMQRKQFALQSTVQAAQSYTQLAELKLRKRQANLEYNYLNSKYEWEKEHGFRDLDWRSELINLIESLKGSNGKPLKDDVKDVLDNIGDEVSDFADENLTYGDNNDFGTFGAVPKMSRWGHTVDNENYGRSGEGNSFKQIAGEIKEKPYKLKLFAKDTENNRKKLYEVDDYLPLHISLENWLKADKDFIKYYLKYGQFEGHKKYF